MPFFAWCFVTLSVLSGTTFILGRPLNATTTSVVSKAQVASFRRYTYYAGAAYCPVATTKAWSCANCLRAPQFKSVASGGDGSSTQFWYVGYDPEIHSVVVAYQGTKVTSVQALITDSKGTLDVLSKRYFPGMDTKIKTHNGFGDAHKKSADAVLAVVKWALKKFKAKKVTLVGHSLGGALATIGAVHLHLHLPRGIRFKIVAYGSPRVGNEAFAKYVTSISEVARINNKEDPVTVIPGRSLGYIHVEGEFHITDQNEWIYCRGQENTSPKCTVASVPNFLTARVADHSGPYGGITFAC